ncbi:MAG: hypothetical protein ACOZCP_16700 [Pseudomonadota bacterium]
MHHQPSAPAAGDSLWSLLYRFFWPFQYFRDVTRGTRLERQQNYRYNRAMRIYLPGFMLKWSFLTGLWFGFGGLLDRMMDLTVPAAGCFVTAGGSFVVVVLLGVSWVWLERFPELFD